MSLAEEVLSAPDRTATRRLLRDRSEEERSSAVEDLASEVLRQIRVDPQRAHEVAERAELVVSDNDTGAAWARARWVKGHVLSAMMRTDEAIQCYRAASAAYARLGQRSEVARVAIGLVNALTYQGRYTDALKLGEKARADLIRTRQKSAAARLDVNLGNLYDRLERPVDALERYNRALRLARAVAPDDGSMISMIRFNRGAALLALGRFGQAERAFLDAADEAERADEPRIRAFVDSNLGFLNSQRGEYAEAYDKMDAARAAFERIGDDHWRTLTILDLVELLSEVGSYRRADAMAAEAQVSTKRLGLRFEYARATLFRGIAQIGAGRATDARASLDEARAQFEREGNATSGAVCEVYAADLDQHAGRPDDAVRRLRPAVRRFERDGLRSHEVAARLSLAASLFALGRRAPAARQLEHATRRLKRVPSPWLRARRSHLAGRIAVSRGDSGAALRHFRRAVSELERIRGRLGVDEFRVSFSESQANVWADLIELVLERGGPKSVEVAFGLVEQARSRALVDLLAGRLPADSTDDPKVASFLRELDELRATMNRLRGFGPANRSGLRRGVGDPVAVRRCEARIAETLRRIERRSASVGALTRGETFSLAEAQRALPADTEIVEYFLGPESSWALVVSNTGARAVRLGIRGPELGRRIARLRFQIEKCCHGSDYVARRQSLLLEGVRRHLSELADVLWAPLELDASRVLLVPHGPLHALPFAALPEASGGLVVDRHLVSTLPSASCRRYLRTASGLGGPETRVLAVEVDAPDLPAARREVDVVRRRFPRGQCLRGKRATRDRFRAAAPEANVIHLATHGLFRPDDATFSSILLSDGWLSVHDIYGLRLQADLVALSACQSGRSWLAAGDEVVGLMRGFLHAGASALLVSLWPVDDEATADLMASFYGAARKGLPLHQALAQAMRSAREARPHPFHWAPFVLVGDTLGGRN